VRAVIFELGADVEIVEVDVFGAGTGTPEFTAVNPNGNVPAFVHGEDEARALRRWFRARLNGMPPTGQAAPTPVIRGVAEVVS
jgi:hypothetical protein